MANLFFCCLFLLGTSGYICHVYSDSVYVSYDSQNKRYAIQKEHMDDWIVKASFIDTINSTG